MRLVGRDTDAPDALVEDACAFASLQLCRFQSERYAVLGWLRVVARREARRLLSQQRGCLSLDQGPPRSGASDDGEEGPLPLVERLARPVDVELAVEAREALRSLADLRWWRRRVLALQAAGYGYKEIAEMLSVTYTNVNRHVTEGRGELRQLRDAA